MPLHAKIKLCAALVSTVLLLTATAPAHAELSKEELAKIAQNPVGNLITYDGHTITDTLNQVTRLSRTPEHVYVDRGYQGHGYDGDCRVYVDKVRRGRTAQSVWRWMKRRAAIEPGIGHLKQEH